MFCGWLCAAFVSPPDRLCLQGSLLHQTHSWPGSCLTEAAFTAASAAIWISEGAREGAGFCGRNSWGGQPREA